MENETSSGVQAIDSAVLEMLACASIFPARITGEAIEWQRMPSMQGDESSYTFVTNGPLKADGLLWMTVADAIYEAGFSAGQKAVRHELQRIVGICDQKLPP